jgi:hypothetical protein
MDYTPFLKLKVNEIAALNALPLEDKRRLSPFFDLPRKDVLTSQSLKALIDTAYRKYEINLTALPFFYLDNYDINDDILVGGDNCYLYALEVFSNANVIPVVGIDRSARRNEVVVLAKKNNLVQNDTVALRIGSEDIVSYKLVEEELLDLLGELNKYFKHFH